MNKLLCRTRLKTVLGPLARLTMATAAAVFTMGSAHGQALFAPGDLVVTTYNVSSNVTDGQPTPISLEEFTPNGTLIKTFTLPTSDSSGNFGIVGEYGSSSEANLQLSGDGHSLLISGYQATASFGNVGGPVQGGYSNANGTALAQSTSASVPRVVAVISATGVVNTTTQVNSIYSTNNPRSVWSANGTTLYLSGQGGGSNDQGIFTVTAGTNQVAGGSAPTPISTNTGLSTRIVSAYNGNLYYSTDVKNVATGIYEYTGIPTSATAATQILPANNGLSGSSLVDYSPDAFFFANATTLYVADTGAPKNKALGDGGIQKWSFNGTAWGLDYTLIPTNFVHNYNDKTSGLTDGEIGFESLTGQVVNGSVSLYGVSYTIGDADQDGLYAITDPLAATTSPGNSFTELATAAGLGDDSTATGIGGPVFKSVAFAPQITSVPEPGTWALILGAAALTWAGWKRRQQSFC